MIFETGSDIRDILAALQTTPMFGEEHLTILENPPDGLDVLALDFSDLTLAIWFDHEIDATKFRSTQVFFFPETKEVSVFPFLDFLGQRDKKAFLELDKLKRTGYESQYFITMIFYLLRNLIVTPKGAKDFVRRKNEKMRENFSKDELVNLYKSILEVDFKIKSGLLETAQADFSMVNKFLRD